MNGRFRRNQALPVKATNGGKVPTNVMTIGINEGRLSGRPAGTLNVRDIGETCHLNGADCSGSSRLERASPIRSDQYQLVLQSADLVSQPVSCASIFLKWYSGICDVGP